MGRPFDRSDRIDPKDLVIERGRPDLDPLGCKGRQGLRPREGRMFSGQFDERPHVRPTVAPRMSLPTTGILKSNGPFGRAVRIRPFVPNDIPAVASIVREALRENYPTSLYLDIHRWWRDGFLVADLDGHPVGFLAAVISADGQARILMFAVTSGFRRRGIGSQLMNAVGFACSVTATSPADRMSPPSLRNRRLRALSLLSNVFARRRASSITTPTASREAGGIRLSTAISWATNCASFARFVSESGIVVSTRISYPPPVIRERNGDRMCGRSWMLHAPTKMKSHGTLSTFTLAPALCGFRPEMGNRFSCIAVRMNRWRWPSNGSSSMKRTPWWASWIAPATTRSYG